jgi:hypothetical protein
VREDEIRQLRRVTSDKGPDDTVADILEEVISESHPRQSLLVIKRLFPGGLNYWTQHWSQPICRDSSNIGSNSLNCFGSLRLDTGMLASGRSDAEARLGFAITTRLKSRTESRIINVLGQAEHLHTKESKSR